MGIGRGGREMCNALDRGNNHLVWFVTNTPQILKSRTDIKMGPINEGYQVVSHASGKDAVKRE